MTYIASFLQAGIMAARNDDRQLAREQLRLHLEGEPESEAGWLWLASVTETAEERLACVERVLEINPANERAIAWLAPSQAACAQEFLTRGVAAAKSNYAEAARNLLHRAIELDPEKELAWLWLASLSVSPAEKLAQLQRVLAINPENGHALTGIRHAHTQIAQALLQQAVAAARGGDRELARERLREAVSHDENIEDASLLAAFLTDDAMEKAAHLRRALEINPDSVRARSALDAVEAQLAPPKPAWECPLCGEAGDSPRDFCANCGAHLSLDDIELFFADAQFDDLRLRQTIVRLRSRCETSDVSADDYYRLGLALLNLRETVEGIECLRTALHLNPQNEQLATAIKVLVACQEQVFARPQAVPGFIVSTVEQNQVIEEQGEVSVVHSECLQRDDAQCETLPEADEPFAGQSDSIIEDEQFPIALPSNSDPLAGRTIMVVDDSPTVRKLVTIKLEKQGHRVIPAVDGVEALALLDEDLPDLILLDITMPRMDGYQLCKLIRANDAMKHIPIVMLSGKDGFFDKVRGRMAGSTDYLTKPFEPETLLRVVAEHCGGTSVN